MSRTRVETLLDILKVLTFEREISQYDLPEKIGKDYRTVLRRIKDLESVEHIKLVRREKSEKLGKKKKIYRTTVQGLVTVLAQVENTWTRIDELASIHKDKLLVFKKWEYFRERGLTEAITDTFKVGVKATVKQRAFWLMLYPHHFDEMVAKIPEKRFAQMLDADILGVPLLPRRNKLRRSRQYEAIWKACKEEPELRKFIEDTQKEELRLVGCEARQIAEGTQHWDSL